MKRAIVSPTLAFFFLDFCVVCLSGLGYINRGFHGLALLILATEGTEDTERKQSAWRTWQRFFSMQASA
jgi:kynureninase